MTIFLKDGLIIVLQRTFGFNSIAMTQGACLILIRLGTLRHLWRSIKSLRKLSRNDDDNGNSTVSSNVHLDILEVWALLGLHSLYMSSGLEQFFQYLPLYFYIKMIGLSLFFFLPSASNQNVIAQLLFDRVFVQNLMTEFLDDELIRIKSFLTECGKDYGILRTGEKGP